MGQEYLSAHASSADTKTIENSSNVCVMLHGVFGMSSNLMSLAKGLSGGFSSVCAPIIYDLPNHGDSPRLDPCSFIDMALMLRESIQKDARGKRLHILGHSLGGKLAMTYALLYPSEVSSLVAMDIAPVKYPNFHIKIIEGIKKVLNTPINSKADIVEILKNYAESNEEASFLAKNFILEDGKLHCKLRILEIEKNYESLLSFPFKEFEGKTYVGEALFMKAEVSNYFKEEYFTDIERYFPSWELEEIPKSGHNIHIDNAKYTLDSIVSFFQQVF